MGQAFDAALKDESGLVPKRERLEGTALEDEYRVTWLELEAIRIARRQTLNETQDRALCMTIGRAVLLLQDLTRSSDEMTPALEGLREMLKGRVDWIVTAISELDQMQTDKREARLLEELEPPSRPAFILTLTLRREDQDVYLEAIDHLYYDRLERFGKRQADF